MRLKIALKQSFHDFLKKITLYLTFTLFLILTISVSLGMISFSYGYHNLYAQTLGNQRINACLGADTFLPASLENDSELANLDTYQGQEQKNEQGKGYLEQFLRDFFELKREDGKEIDLQKLLLGLGYASGSTAKDLEEKSFFQDSLLKKYFPQPEDCLEYNENLHILKREINSKYHTYNLFVAFWCQYFWDHPQDYQIGGCRRWDENLEMSWNDQKEPFYWEFLKVNPSMGALYDQSPKILRTNSTNVQKIWKSLDLGQKKYQDYVNDYHYVYVSQAFLHRYHYRLGDVINLRFKTWDKFSNYPTNFDSYLIAGAISTSEIINPYFYESVIFPYPLIQSTWDKWNSENGDNSSQLEENRARVFSNHVSIFFNVIDQNGSLSEGQKAAADLYSEILTNRRDPNDLLQSKTEWSKTNSVYAYEFSQVLFLAIAYVIGFLTLGLLFIVFYFITQQIIFLQQKTLFFLKAMGVKDSALSLLTTFTMLPSLFFGFVIGFFASLAIQQMMYSIALEKQCFYQGYFSFNFVYFLGLVVIMSLTFFVFYLINTVLIKSKALTLEEMNQVKANNKFYESIKIKMNKVPSQAKIGFSFAAKNVYKNLISYLILTVSFGIILFAAQFNKSLNVSAHAYEKWNQPYKSVLYADNLNVFAPTREGQDLSQDEYLHSYHVIDQMSDLEAIANNDKLEEIITKYLESLASSETDFNWSNYYFDKNYVENTLNLISSNKSARDQFIQWLIEKLKLEDTEQILELTDFVNTIVQKYNQIKPNYQPGDGFNLLLGQVYVPNNTRSVLTLGISHFALNSVNSASVLAYQKDDFSTQKHFALSEFSTSKDFLVDGTYREYDPQTKTVVTKNGKLLRVNISTYLADLENLHVGETLTIEISGLKSVQAADSFKVHAYINKILKEDTIRPTVYTSQNGIVEYALNRTNQELHDFVDPYAGEENVQYVQGLLIQKAAYENLLNQLNDPENPLNLNNSVFDVNNKLPIGAHYLTLPLFHHTDSEKKLGSRLEDFYDQGALDSYFYQIGKNGMIFSAVTQKSLEIAAPFTKMMQKFIIILLIVSLAVSSILIALFLLENKEIILLFKAMGYKKSEINWYLISGYFIATILATITAVAFALLVLNLTKTVIAQFLAIALYFVWSWEFIVLALGLTLAFCLAISVSIIVYTNLQKPRDAFADL